MNESKRQRCIYVAPRQKKRLIELMVKHPELITGKVTPEFNHQDSQKLWQSITRELNSMPGAKKAWRQWKKTWQDLRSKTKKRAEVNGGMGTARLTLLSKEEQEALGVKAGSSEDLQDMDTTEFVQLETENTEDHTYANDNDYAASLSEPDSPPEVKVFNLKNKKHKTVSNNKLHLSNDCSMNCDLLIVQEQRKTQLKEDYINFKKEYLKQKLKCIKEQTEALKTIARELSK